MSNLKSQEPVKDAGTCAIKPKGILKKPLKNEGKNSDGEKVLEHTSALSSIDTECCTQVALTFE